MNTPDIDYTKPDDEPIVFVICNDLIQQIRSRCSDNTPSQAVS